LQGIKDTVADAAPRHKLEKRYPYSDFWVLPRDPTMLRKIDVSDHHLRADPRARVASTTIK